MTRYALQDLMYAKGTSEPVRQMLQEQAAEIERLKEELVKERMKAMIWKTSYETAQGYVDQYQREADDMAAAHKVEKDALFVERDAAVADAGRLREAAAPDIAAARFKAQHQFLEWNRAQEIRPVMVAYEYAVFANAADFYDAARAALKE